MYNPSLGGEEKKTETAILFSDNGKFIGFGSDASQKYAEMLDEGETGLFFRTVSINSHLLFSIVVQNVFISKRKNDN